MTEMVSEKNIARKGNKPSTEAHGLLFKVACHPFLISMLFYCVAMLSVYIAGQQQTNVGLKRLAQTNIESIISFVAETVQSLNTEAWEREDATAFVLPPISGKDQIRSIVIVNALGGIVYPETRAYDILEDDNLERVLRSDGKQIHIYDSKQRGTFYHPVFIGEVLKGAIILNYNRKNEEVAAIVRTFNASVLAFLLAGVIGTLFLVWLILLPWRSLHAVVEDCLETGDDVNLPHGAYRELNKMIKLFRLLLLRRK